MSSIGLQLAVRCLLVALFLPFSALDKLLNFRAAVAAACATIASRSLARMLIVGGFCIEVSASAAILTGIADRLAAVILGLYCIITAVLWKRFWTIADFKLRGPSRGRETFWDFLKNLALAGGFLLLAIGTDPAGIRVLVHHPLTSSHPYQAGH